MLNSIKMSLLILSGAVLIACGTVGKIIKDDYTFKAGGKMGLVAVSGSLVDECGRVGGFTASMRHKENPGTDTELIVRNMLMTPDFTQPSGHFFVFELPAGHYSLSRVWATGLMLTSRQSTDTPTINFDVKPGEVRYVGEFEFTVTKDCLNYTYQVKNSWQRDKALFSQRVPNIKAETVRVQPAAY